MPSLDQTDYDLRFDVGPLAAARLAPFSDALVVVDVLSFSTAVAVAVARGAVVYPYPFKRRRKATGLPLAGRLATTGTGDGAPETYANSLGALCAGRRGTSRYSLSPPTLKALSPGDRIVLPSPNGATVSLAAPATPSFAGCLRNAEAVAAAAQALGRESPSSPAASAGKRTTACATHSKTNWAPALFFPFCPAASRRRQLRRSPSIAAPRRSWPSCCADARPARNSSPEATAATWLAPPNSMAMA